MNRGVGKLRWLLCFLCVFIVFGCCDCLALAMSDVDTSDHQFKLFLRKDGSGYYTCLCLVDGCEKVIDVYPQGYVLEPTVATGECSHVFVKGDKLDLVSIEGVSSLHHEVAQWYECACVACGLTIEAYETDGSYYLHEVSVWEDMHISGEHKHLYVGHCDACGAMQYDIVNCMQYEDGTCMDGWDFVSPVIE